MKKTYRENYKRCVVYKFSYQWTPSIKLNGDCTSAKKLNDLVTMTTVGTFARPCVKGHAIIMMNWPRNKEKNLYSMILTLGFRLSNYLTSLDGNTRCHFMSGTISIRSDWFHPLIKSYSPNNPLTKQRNQKAPTGFTTEFKQRIHFNDMAFLWLSHNEMGQQSEQKIEHS